MLRLVALRCQLLRFLKLVVSLLKQTAEEWLAHNAPRMGAAIAFYTVSSLAPLLIIAIGVAALFFGQQAAEGQIVSQMQSLVGQSGAEALQAMLAGARRHSSGALPTAIGLATLFVTSTGLFVEMQDDLNTVWDAKPKPDQSSVRALLRSRILSFGLVLGVGFLLLVSLIISAVLSALDGSLSRLVPSYPRLLQLTNQLISFFIVSLLFAMMYKVLPDAKIAWRDVIIGSAFTALLFTLGKFLIGLYLGHSFVASAYGAAGSFVIILVWIYYSSLLFFFGAEFTQVYSKRHGSRALLGKSVPA